MKFDIKLHAELLIYTGYAWRNMTEAVLAVVTLMENELFKKDGAE